MKLRGFTERPPGLVAWSVGRLTSQQHASVSRGRICSDNFTCCHTEIGVADQIFCLTQSQYTDTRPTSPSADPIAPGRIAAFLSPDRGWDSQSGFGLVHL